MFISSYQYIIDAYETYAASALASVTLIRYVAAGGIVEVAVSISLTVCSPQKLMYVQIPFYKNLGVHWTLTILGCIAALLAPVPYVFFFVGPRIRRSSKYAIV